MKNTKKLAVAGVFCAVAVVGSLLSFPVFGSKCSPVQHMVNILCAILLGPGYGLGAAFSAALILASRDSILGLSEKILRKSQTISLIEHAAQQGLLAAQKYLADCYRDGHYVRKSKKRMAEYIAICAQQGDEQSLLRLARCYERGIGVKEDRKKSYSYYQQLAQKGNGYAQKKVREYEYYGDFLFDRTKLEDL